MEMSVLGKGSGYDTEQKASRDETNNAQEELPPVARLFFGVPTRPVRPVLPVPRSQIVRLASWVPHRRTSLVEHDTTVTDVCLSPPAASSPHTARQCLSAGPLAWPFTPAGDGRNLPGLTPLA